MSAPSHTAGCVAAAREVYSQFVPPMSQTQENLEILTRIISEKTAAPETAKQRDELLALNEQVRQSLELIKKHYSDGLQDHIERKVNFSSHFMLMNVVADGILAAIAAATGGKS